jgi:CheY-like chemotaxis protein
MGDADRSPGPRAARWLARARAAPLSTRDPAAPPAGRDHRVMVIEDNDAIREGFRLVLLDGGYEVTAFASGRRAFEHLRSGQALPGLILLDLLMPEMDGYQFRSEQSADRRLARIPTILVTAGAPARPIDVTRVLRKPIDLDVLLETVRLELERPPWQ